MKLKKSIAAVLGILVLGGTGGYAWALSCDVCIGQCMDGCSNTANGHRNYLNCIAQCPQVCKAMGCKKSTNGGFGGGN